MWNPVCVFLFSIFQARVLGLTTPEAWLLHQSGLGLLPFQILLEVSPVRQDPNLPLFFVVVCALLQFHLLLSIPSILSMRSVGVWLMCGGICGGFFVIIFLIWFKYLYLNIIPCDICIYKGGGHFLLGHCGQKNRIINLFLMKTICLSAMSPIHIEILKHIRQKAFLIVFVCYVKEWGEQTGAIRSWRPLTASVFMLESHAA